MASASELFTSSVVSQYYIRFRPKPPSKLIDGILSFMNAKLLPPFHQAVDVGCGSGQSTSILAPHFTNVLGIDVSEAQLNEARKQEQNNNVSYKVASYECVPVEDRSVDLITVSQALHWFDLPLFFKEADRILKPNGVLAAYCYGFPTPINFNSAKTVKGYLQHMYTVETAGYWHENRKIVDAHYKNVNLPYGENVREEIYSEDNDWSVADLVGYIQSWSGYQALLEAKPEKAKEVINSFQNNVMNAIQPSLPPEQVKFNVQWHYTLLMCRKPL